MARTETDLGRISGRQLAASRSGIIMDNMYVNPASVDDNIKLHKGDFIIMATMALLVEIAASPYDDDFNPSDWRYPNYYVIGKQINLKGAQGAKGPQGDPGQMDIVFKQERDTGDTLAGKKIYCRGMKTTAFTKENPSYVYDTNLTNIDQAWIDMSNSFLECANGDTFPLVYNNLHGDASLPNIEVFLKTNYTKLAIRGKNVNGCIACITIRYTKN